MYPTIASIMTPKYRKAVSEQPYPESPVVEIIDHGQDFVTIEWETTDYTDLYRIFRAEGNGGYIQLGTDIPDNQSSFQFTDDTVEPGIRYRYRVYAVNEKGGGNSNTVEITIEASEPPVGFYELTILSPTEVEEVQPDFSLIWEDNTTQITITSPTENEEVGSDFTLEYETA